MMTAKELRQRRLHLGLSRDQLAHTLGMPLDEVAEWEEGSAPIRTPVAVEHVLRRFEEPIDEKN